VIGVLAKPAGFGTVGSATTTTRLRDPVDLGSDRPLALAPKMKGREDRWGLPGAFRS